MTTYQGCVRLFDVLWWKTTTATTTTTTTTSGCASTILIRIQQDKLYRPNMASLLEKDDFFQEVIHNQQQFEKAVFVTHLYPRNSHFFKNVTLIVDLDLDRWH